MNQSDRLNVVLSTSNSGSIEAAQRAAKDYNDNSPADGDRIVLKIEAGSKATRITPRTVTASDFDNFHQAA